MIKYFITFKYVFLLLQVLFYFNVSFLSLVVGYLMCFFFSHVSILCRTVANAFVFAAVSPLHECMSLRSNIFCFITVASFHISFTRFFLRRWHVLVCLCVCMRLWQKVHMFVSIKVHKRRHFFGCQWSRGKTFLDVIDMHSIFMLFKHQSDPLRRSVSIRHLYLKKQPL